MLATNVPIARFLSELSDLLWDIHHQAESPSNVHRYGGPPPDEQRGRPVPIDRAKNMETDWNSIQHRVRTMWFSFKDLLDILHWFVTGVRRSDSYPVYVDFVLGLTSSRLGESSMMLPVTDVLELLGPLRDNLAAIAAYAQDPFVNPPATACRSLNNQDQTHQIYLASAPTFLAHTILALSPYFPICS